jgi:hypothetical protein
VIFLIPKPLPDVPNPRQPPDLPRLIAMGIQQWLAQLLARAMTEYAEKKNPTDRSLQSGHAWTAFAQTFGPLTGSGLLHVCLGLCRFAASDDPLAPVLSGAGRALFLEHDSTGEFLGPKNPDLSRETAQALLLARQSIERWCAWIDASVHLLTHSCWHSSRACFDPDPDKRDLACLGVIQRHFARQPESIKMLWQHVYSEAAERFKDSPKWPALGQAMSSQSDKPWTYRQLDTLIISLWPLLKRHNWTYRDLMNVTRSLISRPDAYPCQREQDFSVHCLTVLGLRKTGRGKSSPDGRPPGHQIAREIYTAALLGFPPLDPQP